MTKYTNNSRGKVLFFVIIIAVIVIIGILYIAYTGLLINKNDGLQLPATALDASGVLRISSDKESYKVGDEVNLVVSIVSNRPIDGVDVELSYDTDLIELVEEPLREPPKIENSATVYLAVNDSSFSNFPYAKTDINGSEGTFSFAAIASPGEGVVGESVVGRITFIARAAGNTRVDFVYEGNEIPTDSNIAYMGRDILASVEGVTFTITDR